MCKPDFIAYPISVVTGMVLWFAAMTSSGKREPWDDPAYWSTAYPAAIVVCGVLGFFFSRRSWRWPLALFFGQFLAMIIRAGEPGNLWPLGLLLFLGMSLPGMAVAKLGGWLRDKLAIRKP
jgi:peptidoglycan/LPS O-acetylase OafA/YrhL